MLWGRGGGPRGRGGWREAEEGAAKLDETPGQTGLERGMGKLTLFQTSYIVMYIHVKRAEVHISYIIY